MSMRSFHTIGLVAGSLLAGTLLAGEAPDLEARSARSIRYPDYDAKGQLNYEVLGDEARVLPGGQILVANLKLVFYEEGRKMMEVTAPECYFDRARQVASSATSMVHLARSELILTGRGYIVTWTNNLGHVELASQVRVVLKSGAKP